MNNLLTIDKFDIGTMPGGDKAIVFPQMTSINYIKNLKECNFYITDNFFIIKYINDDSKMNLTFSLKLSEEEFTIVNKLKEITVAEYKSDANLSLSHTYFSILNS